MDGDPYRHLDEVVRTDVTDGTASGETDRHNRLLGARRHPARPAHPRARRRSAGVDGEHVPRSGVAAPIAVAPMAAHRRRTPHGELAVAGAAARIGIPMVLSLSSTTPVEAVAAVDGIDLCGSRCIPSPIPARPTP